MMFHYAEILIDDSGYCKRYAFDCSLNSPQAIRIKIDKDFDLDDFLNYYSAYYLDAGSNLLVDSNKYMTLYQNKEKEKFRYQRENECFPIVNRGKLWYDNLSPEQLTELQAWYQAWLDVTETLVIPEAPIWINEQ